MDYEVTFNYKYMYVACICCQDEEVTYNYNYFACICCQDEEVLLFEKEQREAEAALRRRLALETEAALAQQEKELALLIGRLEVKWVFFLYEFMNLRQKAVWS